MDKLPDRRSQDRGFESQPGPKDLWQDINQPATLHPGGGGMTELLENYKR